MASLTPVQRTARAIPARRRLAFRLLDDRNFLGLAHDRAGGGVLAGVSRLSAWPGLLARHDRRLDRPAGPLRRLRQLRFPRPRSRYSGSSVFNTTFYTVVASIAEIWLGSLSGAFAQSPTADEVAHPRRRAAAVCHADRAVGDRLLVDLRSAVLDHLLVAHQTWPHPPVHRFSRPALERALVGDRRQCLARHPVRGDNAARGLADDLALALRGGDARRRGPVAAFPLRHPADAVADHRRRHDLLGAAHLHRLPAHLRHHARGPDQRHPSDGDALVSSAPSPGDVSARARRSPTPWCRFCWRPSCSVISDCSGDAGSKARETDDGCQRRRDRRHGLSRAPAAPAVHALSSARRLPVRLAVSVLLDDDDDLEARRRALRLRALQSLLGRTTRRSTTSRSCFSRRAIPPGSSTP